MTVPRKSNSIRIAHSTVSNVHPYWTWLVGCMLFLSKFEISQASLRCGFAVISQRMRAKRTIVPRRLSYTTRTTTQLLDCTSSTARRSTASETQVVRNMLHRIRQVNDMPPHIVNALIPFVVDGLELGKVTPTIAETLCTATPASPFELSTTSASSSTQKQCLTLSVANAGTTCESRTQAVMTVMQELRSQGMIAGWRDELYPIGNDFYRQPPVLLMERSAVPYVGGLEYGVHMNGLVVVASDAKPAPPFRMWMARRSKTKPNYPGMLDHIVAGGQPHDLGLYDNVVKECMEEAGIPEEITRECMKAAGAISYETYSPSKQVVSRAVLFCFDLHLPSDFVPKPVDGEVEEFFLWDINELKASMAPDFTDPIKPNCYPVIIDCMLRHGVVSPEANGYLDILRELRSAECY